MTYFDKSIPELLFEGLAKNTSQKAIATKKHGNWTVSSIEDFKNNIKYLALAMHKLGVKKGDRISIHAENSAFWLITDLAALSIGAADVPIYKTQPADQIKYILDDSGVKIHFVSDDALLDPSIQFVKEAKGVGQIVTFYKSSHSDTMLIDELFKIGAELDKEQPTLFDSLLSKVTSKDLATLMYTSGTTGLPKGVMLTHDNIGSNFQRIPAYIPFEIEKNRDKNIMSFLPLSHSFERVVSYSFIYMGFPIYYIEKPDEIIQDIQYIKPIFFATVPRLLEKLYVGFKGKANELSGVKKKLFNWAMGLAEKFDVENPNAQGFKRKIATKLIYSKLHEALGGNLEAIISGGAALSREIMSFINGIGVFCSQGYGLTETSPVLTVMAKGELRLGSAGRAIPDVELKIAEDGEILAKGPNIMSGYYNLPDKTKEVFTDDGWFCTGDVGHIDNDGYLFITDRKKDLFKLSTGKYVAPQNVENQLINSMFIEQSFVLGHSKKFCAALVVPDFVNIRKTLGLLPTTSNQDVLKNEQVIALLEKEVHKANENLSPWEQVKKYSLLEQAFTIESGELTPTLKLKRKVVSEKYKDKIDSMYQE